MSQLLYVKTSENEFIIFDQNKDELLKASDYLSEVNSYSKWLVSVFSVCEITDDEYGQFWIQIIPPREQTIPGENGYHGYHVHTYTGCIEYITDLRGYMRCLSISPNQEITIDELIDLFDELIDEMGMDGYKILDL